MHTLCNPEMLLRREDAARKLTEAGFPISKATLATLATRGGGPRFARFGRRPLYKYEDLIAWAEGRLSSPMGSTSEASNPQQTSALGRARRASDPAPDAA
jgi:hypothetical protein